MTLRIPAALAAMLALAACGGDPPPPARQQPADPPPGPPDDPPPAPPSQPPDSGGSSGQTTAGGGATGGGSGGGATGGSSSGGTSGGAPSAPSAPSASASAVLAAIGAHHAGPDLAGGSPAFLPPASVGADPEVDDGTIRIDRLHGAKYFSWWLPVTDAGTGAPLPHTVREKIVTYPVQWNGRAFRGAPGHGAVFRNLPKLYPSFREVFSDNPLPKNDAFFDERSETFRMTPHVDDSKNRIPREAIRLDEVPEEGAATFKLVREEAASWSGAGHLFGAPGTFTIESCTAANSGCGLSRISANEVGYYGGTLVFTPEGGDLERPVPWNPPPFVHFGYWMSPPAAGGDPPVIETFALGSGYDPLNLDAATGTARWEGAAAGFWATPSRHGEFTAKVELEADFDTGAPEVSGRVSGFRAVTGGGDLGGWALRLGPAGGAGGIGFTGDTAGGGKAGWWSGSFYGNRRTNAEEGKPEAVAGEFNGHFANGSAAGAFGAELRQ